MIQYKRILLLVAAVTLAVGKSWADDKPKAGATPTVTAAKAPAKAVKGENPAVTAMKAALALDEAGKFDDAIAAFEKLGVLKSTKLEAWRLNNEALSYIHADKSDKALPLLEKATTTDSTNYIAWNNLGTTYEAANQLDKAKEAYQKAIDAATAAGASTAKAQGNLDALQARLDKKGGNKSDDSSDDSAKAPDDKKADQKK